MKQFYQVGIYSGVFYNSKHSNDSTEGPGQSTEDP